MERPHAALLLLLLALQGARVTALNLPTVDAAPRRHGGLSVSPVIRDVVVVMAKGQESTTKKSVDAERQVITAKAMPVSLHGVREKLDERPAVTSGVELEEYDQSTEGMSSAEDATTRPGSGSVGVGKTTPTVDSEEEGDEYGAEDELDDPESATSQMMNYGRTTEATADGAVSQPVFANVVLKGETGNESGANSEVSQIEETQGRASGPVEPAEYPNEVSTFTDPVPLASTVSEVATEVSNVSAAPTITTDAVKAAPSAKAKAGPSGTTSSSSTISVRRANVTTAVKETVTVAARVNLELTTITSTTENPSTRSGRAENGENSASSPATTVSTVSVSVAATTTAPSNAASTVRTLPAKADTPPDGVAPTASAAAATTSMAFPESTTLQMANSTVVSGVREVEDLEPGQGSVDSSVTTEQSLETTTIKDYQEELDEFLSQLTNRLLPVATRFLGDSNLSPDCVSQIWKLYQGLRRQEAWALRLITSTGLLPANLFEGALSNFGSYEQCLRTKVFSREGESDIRGQYCTLYFRAPELFYNRTVEQFNAIGEMKGRRSFLSWEKNPRGFANTDIRSGICIPSGCSQEDINYLANAVLRDYGAKATVQDCRTESPLEMSELQVGILCALGGSVGLVLLATLVELCLMCSSKLKTPESMNEGTASLTTCHKLQANKRVPVKVVKCFSLIHNTKSLLNTEFKSDCPRKPVRFVYGVKVLMAMWVILGHSYYTTNFQALHSGFQIMDLYSQVHAQLLGSAFYGISTFFFLSGFVLAYFMRQAKEESIMRPFMGLYLFAVIRRYLRHTVPAMVVVLCFFLFPLFISGPQDRDLMGQEQRGCFENWWTVMAHIVNFVPTEKRCMQQFWYVSSDMQIFLVAVPLSLIFVRSPACGFSIALLLSVLCSVAAGLVTYMKNLKPAIAYTIEDFSRNLETAEFVHELPYSNLATYFMGVLSGYCAATWNKAVINKVLQAFLWLLALSLNVFLVFVPYAWNRCDTDDMKQLYTSFYGGSYRYLWGLSWCWIAYACATGRGGFLCQFLSWNPFVVLGRLTFGVYLVQYVVFIARLGVSTAPLQVNEFLQVKDSLGVAAISYFLAYLLHVVYEAPVSGITGMIFKFHTRRKPANKPPPQSESPLPPPEPPTPPPPEMEANGTTTTTSSQEP